MKFELKGYNIDNLLLTLYNKKIVLYNVERVNYNQIKFEVLDKQVKKVKRYIANFKIKQTLSFVRRLPKLLLANLGIFLGVFFGFLFYIFSSNYIWQIQIYGTKHLTTNEILQVLQNNGVSKGKLNLVTSEQIEDILLNHYNRIAQVSVIKQGTAIIINVSEKLVYEETEYKPITAKFNGIIKEINIITGTTNIKVGDYVNVGDILVLPFNLDANNHKISVQPKAEIKADIFVVNKTSLSTEEKVLERTGRSITVYEYKLLNFNIFSSKNKNSFALFETNVYNENIADIIPFSRDVITFYELAYTIKHNNLEQEKESLISRSKQEAHKNLPIGNIVNEQTTTTILNNTMFAITTITVYGIIND